MIMTQTDIKLEIHEQIIMHESDPDVIRDRVQALLAGLRDNDETIIGAVLHEAREIAHVRHLEFVRLDGDIERVVAVFDACLEPMIAWLTSNGRTTRAGTSSANAHGKWRGRKMGYDIRSRANGEQWSCNQSNWGFYVDLAVRFGWVPEHHEPHYYIGNDYQEVSEKDAMAFAKALRLAISHIVNMGTDEETLRTFDRTHISLKQLRDLADLATDGAFIIT